MVVKMENKNKTFKAWITYQALYAHFTREYDYFKYNGKLNMSEYSMETQFAKYEGGGQYSAQRQIFLILEIHLNIKKISYFSSYHNLQMI